nr:MAG TPA: MOLONEY MURINE LEUKEMIA VIRUS CAPSID MURINE LEUKEMIA VIRUS CAPSID [Caudoviricetes sp.]
MINNVLFSPSRFLSLLKKIFNRHTEIIGYPFKLFD